MVIAAGSYPAGHWFESDRRYQTNTPPKDIARRACRFDDRPANENLQGLAAKRQNNEVVSFGDV